ncbi:GMC family oxidoreductase [Mycolicibacterium diernhoferi]|nr:GMC family oxidoreductase [Mycolicibacterium diernhoferi]
MERRSSAAWDQGGAHDRARGFREATPGCGAVMNVRPSCGVTVDDRVTETLDVIVVGGGLAGSVSALAVGEAGYSVGVIECGRSRLQEPEPGPTMRRKLIARLIGHPLPRVGRWPVPLMRETGRGRSATPMAAVLGIGPGGSSTVYGAALSRYRRSDFAPLRPPGALPREWPFEYDEFRPFYARMEKMLRIAGTPDPLDADDDAMLRSPPPLGPRDTALVRAMREAGLHPYRLHVGIDYLPGCSECLGDACPRACKADGYNRALQKAETCGALVYPEETVVRLEPVPDGVLVISREGGPGAADGADRVRLARTVVLAAGALNTPLILARSSGLWRDGFPPPMLGRGLMFHVTDILGLRVPHQVPNYGPQKTLAIRDLCEGGEVQSMAMRVGAAPIASFLRGEAERLGFGWLGVGLEALRVPAAIAARYLGAAATFATVQEDYAYPGNRVWEDSSHPERIRFRYDVSAELRERSERSRRVIRERLHRLRPFFLSQLATPNWGHPMGTCRMGVDPAESVTDSQGRVWGLSNVVVADAATLPSSGSTNPALTVAANALRIAEALVGRMNDEARPHRVG